MNRSNIPREHLAGRDKVFTRATLLIGSLITSVAVFGSLRYLSPETGGLVVGSGPHIAAAICLGSLSNVAVEKTNGKERYSLKHALVCGLLTGLGCLAINHGFELYGHPLDRMLDRGANPALSLRQQGNAYGDWKTDDITTGLSGVISYLATAATFKFGQVKDRTESFISALRLWRSSQH